MCAGLLGKEFGAVQPSTEEAGTLELPCMDLRALLAKRGTPGRQMILRAGWNKVRNLTRLFAAHLGLT